MSTTLDDLRFEHRALRSSRLSDAVKDLREASRELRRWAGAGPFADSVDVRDEIANAREALDRLEAEL